MTTKLTNYQKEIKAELLARGIEVVQSGAGKSSFIGKEPMPSDERNALFNALDLIRLELELDDDRVCPQYIYNALTWKENN